MFEKFEKYSFPKLGYIRIPRIKVEESDLKRLNIAADIQPEEYLKKLAQAGFNAKVESGKIENNSDVLAKYQARLDFELSEINKLYFTNYILLVYKVINFCKQNDILNGYGRGSAAGSLLLYFLGVTKVDPIEHDLLFERFVSAARTEVKEFNGEKYIASGMVADVDLDSCRNKKHLINEFIEKEYPNRTAAIKNISTYQGKILIKDVYKIVDNASEDQAKDVADMFESVFGKVDSIDETAEKNKKFKEWSDKNQETVLIAKKLTDLARNYSIHASGIIICDEILDESIPTEVSSEDMIVTAYDMNGAQLFGIKLDNLGLKNLGIIDDCLKMIGKTMDDIDLNHPSIYQFVNTKDEFYGIFQAEEGLGKNILKKLNCQSLNDLAISISTGRPGSMDFVDDIVLNKTNKTFRQLDDRVDHILKPTYGIIIYQEQIMALSRIMAKFTPQEADGLRKGIGKKIVEKVKEYKEKFVKQSIENGYNEDLVNELWSVFEKSGHYLFNKSHGVSYCSLTACTIYLKANYTKEYYTCLLNNTKHESKPIEEISIIQKELSKFGMKLLGPDLLKSNINFTIDGNDIRFGLGSIKGVSEKTIEHLNEFKKHYTNKFQVFQAAKECGLSVGTLSAIISAGCLDTLLAGNSRSKMVLEAQTWNLLTEKEKVLCLEYGPQYEYKLFKLIKDLNTELKNEKGKPFIKDSRFATIKKNYEPYKQIFDLNSKSESLCNYFYETKLLGYSYSNSLREIYLQKQPELKLLSEIKDKKEGESCFFIGTIQDCKLATANNEKKTKYFKADVVDETGLINVLIFSNPKYDKIQECIDLNGKLPEKDDIVIIRGRRKGDSVFADTISVQNQKIYQKFSEIEK